MIRDKLIGCLYFGEKKLIKSRCKVCMYVYFNKKSKITF